MHAWLLTDGKAGDETQCIGVAESLGCSFELRHVKPRAPWVWFMPWGPVDPRENALIAPPFPDLLIASGRRTVPYVQAIRRASEGRTFTVFLKDPRTGAGTADVIWVPEHDDLRGRNVIVTPTSPHRISAERLAQARQNPHPALAALPGPRAAVLLGGDSRHHLFTPEDIARLLADLEKLAASGVTLMVTASRRTPAALREGAAALVRARGGFIWDGQGENPYMSMLALADLVVVTADSVNMVGEAVATGAPVFFFSPSGGTVKIKNFLHILVEKGAIRPFLGHNEGFSYRPINATPLIAEAIRSAMRGHKV